MSTLIQSLRQHLPEHQVITDDLRRLAYGTDASFYRLIPQVVAVIESEDEARAVLETAHRHQTPVTFRAAGTSLSGQAISDGVLALIGEGFSSFALSDDASLVRVGPGAPVGGVPGGVWTPASRSPTAGARPCPARSPMNIRTVGDVMTRELVTVDITDTAQEAARRMKDNGTGNVVVTDSGRITGILTDRDLAVRLVAEGLAAHSRVGELVVTDLVTCAPDTALADAVRLMKQHDVRRLPVVEGDTAVGILSIGDLALLTDAGDLLADISAAPDNGTRTV